MDNFDLKDYLKNNPLLTEIRVIQPGIPKLFPEEYRGDLNIFTETFGESSSPENILEPIEERYSFDPEDYEEDSPYFKAYSNILNNLNGVYLTSDFFFYPAPGAPNGSFDVKITVDQKDKLIRVESVGISYEGESAGWFDFKGDYYPDLKNFTEDGEPIENIE
jgi:hypothetical protein